MGRIAAIAFGTFLGAAAAVPACADEEAGWRAPFGGFFSAYFTATTDYAVSGISNTELGPAFQAGIDYRSPPFGLGVPFWLYLFAWGSNVSFPSAGAGEEIQLGGGFKLRAFERRLGVDVGYIRHLYPSFAASFGFEYGEVGLKVDYNFGPASLSGRLRYSPNAYGNSGASWDKRALLSVPLSFVRIADDVSFKVYGSLGNFWVDRNQAYGIPTNDYWYWQVGLVTSAFGLDISVAYTDTSIEPAGCAFTRYCSGRVYASVTKVF